MLKVDIIVAREKRSRILNLTLMVAAVLTLIWRQVPSVGELTRMLEQEELLWGKAVQVSQQALSQRFLSFPAELFEGVFHRTSRDAGNSVPLGLRGKRHGWF